MLFKQVYQYIVGKIERNEWQAGEKLPSIRLLAEELGVHRLTVFKAYQLLKENGKALVKEKSGYYVKDAQQSCHALDPDLEAAPPTVLGEFKNNLSEIQAVPVAYQFSQALIDPNLLPNLFLSEYVKKVFDIYPKLMGSYSPVQGDIELRELLCRYIAHKHKAQLKLNEILITSGATQAIDLIARLYIRPLDAILVERPTYSGALDVFRIHGARLIPVEISIDGYDLEQVEALMKQHRPRFFYMNPTFHNPTGYTVPSAQRKLLVELAERYRCILVEDDAFHEMYFDTPPPPPLFTYDTEGWVLYIRSFSKYVAPGLRICAIICRQSVMGPLVTVKSLADNGTPLVNQKIFLHYFQSDRMQQHLKKLRIALQVRRDIMEAELHERTNWEWVRPKGGLNLWLKLPDTFPVETLLQACFQHSISFVPGTICDPLQQMKPWIRLNYSFINEEKLREGIRKLTDISRQFEA
ncbi:aminotransferase-like domain-containing protein [Paenibacillus aestuarii]|uniref:PLP-dependent aminotransferase family protein n=1 Tax=Paenibacillus aestuarii TaxID=516965 RepID=A0ABW0K5B5_9BACL|nr:PLP-dependent aminotransferase family protein [Paenibacillus aestuarii]